MRPTVHDRARPDYSLGSFGKVCHLEIPRSGHSVFVIQDFSFFLVILLGQLPLPSLISRWAVTAQAARPENGRVLLRSTFSLMLYFFACELSHICMSGSQGY